MKKSKSNTGKMVAVGAGAAAIGASAYYLLGPDKKAHQKKAKVLLGKMEKEVKAKAKAAKEVAIPAYHKMVDTVSETYKKQYKAHEKDIKNLAQKLKQEWKSEKAQVKKTIKKEVKKATKK